MQNITIGRYRPAAEHGIALPPGSIDTVDVCNGWIEGVRNDGSTWIMFFDGEGSPDLFWGTRDADGGVEGDAIVLSDRPDHPYREANQDLTRE